MKEIKVGPLLGLESDNRYTVCFSTPVTVQAAEVLMGGDSITCDNIGTTPSSTLWRAEYDASVRDDGQQVSYEIKLDGDLAQCQNQRDEWHFFIPGRQEKPRFVYTSCNGFSSLDLMHKTQHPYYLWKDMTVQHDREPFSLMLMGGDQLYADNIWSAVSQLREWGELSHDDKVNADITPKLTEEIEDFYDDLYQMRWTNKDMSLMLSCVPSIMMWDDHDIFDGWGSYPKDIQTCDVFEEIFRIAKNYFEMFQVRSKKNKSLLASHEFHYASGLKFRDYHILALDNRAERTLDQVMSAKQWAAVNKYLGEMDAEGHMLVLSAVPVVYRDFSCIESIIDATPWEEELTDDLKDHWRANEHQGERARLIHRLLVNAERRNEGEVSYKTVILSGDVHIGSIGLIKDQSKNCNIHQVVSSGIVHPAPSRLQWMGIMAATNDRDEYLDENRDIRISMLKPFSSNKYIRHRNYVTINMGDDEKLWVNWQSEGKSKPYYPIQ